MLKFLLFTILYTNLLALELTLSSAKEDFVKYSILNIKNNNKFICQENKDNFDVVTKIICAFENAPNTKFTNLQNDFFKLESKIKNKVFFLIIKPNYKIKLYPMIFDLVKDDTTFNANVKFASHWMILGYKEKIPYIKETKRQEVSLNLPFSLVKDNLPYVGGLDIKGNPVHIKKVQDVTDYINVKKYYNQKKYDKALSLIDEIMELYPNSLFKAEFLFYKIRIYSKLKDYSNIIDFSKEYLKDYSSDENVPEVLSLIANAYSMEGLNSDADYFFDRLFSEHEDSLYVGWGQIYKAEMLEGAGESTKAIAFYKKALLETSDLDIASTATYKLTQYYISQSKIKKASIYISKIIKAKPDFFVNNFKDSLDMMNSFASYKKYKIASDIADAILKKINNKNDEYEKLLRDKAVWLAKTSSKNEALNVINRYLKEYKYGTYSDELIVVKDELFFDTTNDENLSTRLATFDNLIETYKDDTIGQKAIYEKAKLLLEVKEYKKVLAMKSELLALDSEIYEDIDSIIKNSAIGIMTTALNAKKCNDVIKTSTDYNITLSNKWDDGLFDCSMIGSDFRLAKTISTRNIKSKDIDLRKKWLYRYIKVEFETAKYDEVIKASGDLIALIDDDKKTIYNNVYRYVFDIYQRERKFNKMIDTIVKIEEIYGFTFKDIDRFTNMISVALKNNDDNMLIKYATKVIQMQDKAKAYPQTPYVEFSLYQAYLDKEQFDDALKVIRSLNDKDLSPKQRARQKYLLGTIYDKLWREKDAKKAYEESIKADANSSWAKLAEDAKSL